MLWIILFLVAHWALTVFCQSFYLHRYAAHGMFTMSKGWEKFFHLFTIACQGSSFLSPRAYAMLHREHHAFSDTDKDPHSPHRFPRFFQMMDETKKRYGGFVRREIVPEERFEGRYPEMPRADVFFDRMPVRIAIGALYTLFYIAVAPHWAFFLLLPVHYLMGPIHGAMVNWAGHKYGYRNYDTNDRSKNTLFIDFLVGGELYQNNHHKFGMDPNFAKRWFEFDTTYAVMRVLNWVGIIEMELSPKRSRAPKPRISVPAQSPAS